MEWFLINDSKPGYIMSAQHYLNYRNGKLIEYDEQTIKQAIDYCISIGLIELNHCGNFVLTTTGYKTIINKLHLDFDKS